MLSPRSEGSSLDDLARDVVSEEGHAADVDIAYNADAVPPPNNAPPEPADEAPRRRLPIFKQYLEIFGYTEGCRTCEATQNGKRHGAGHTAACRERMEDHLMGSQRARKRLCR